MKIQYLIIDDFIPITFIADERSKSLKFYDCVITILDIVNSVSVISSYWRSAKVDVNSINDFWIIFIGMFYFWSNELGIGLISYFNEFI
jgi:hypothetical protein